MTDREPSLADVLRQSIEHRLAGLHVCLPGEIVSYDAATQTASVRPTIKQVVRSFDGEEVTAYPTIPSVPVAHPRAGDWFVHMPLTPGDTVILVFGERSLDQWRLLGGVQDPLDLRKHDLSDAIAIPGNLYSDARALVGVASTTLSLGRQGGSTIHVKATGEVTLGSETPTDSVATALKVEAARAALNTMLTVLAADMTALGVATGIGASTAAAIAALLLNPAWTASVASTKVKADP